MGKLVEVSGVGSPDEVTKRLTAVIDAYQHGGRLLPAARRLEEQAMRRTPEEIAKMRRAGKVVAEMHRRDHGSPIKPGRDDPRPRPRRPRGARAPRRAGRTSSATTAFPAVICTSPNNMIVHGIPGDYVLEEGDIISIDCGAIIEGYHGDAAYTAAVGRDLGRGRAPAWR